VVEAIAWRCRTGSPWLDLLERFGPWQTAWKQHARFSQDGTRDKTHTALLAEADAVTSPGVV
jgi:transposase